MSVSVSEQAPMSAPAAEVLGSDELYRQVLEYALPLSVLEPGESDWRDIFYDVMKVQRTPSQEMAGHPNGHNLSLKYEGGQPGGHSFKARTGAYSVMMAVFQNEHVKELHIASQGNAANGAAFAANKYGVRLTAHVTKTASAKKVAKLVESDVNVVADYLSLEDGLKAADKYGREENAATLHPFDRVESMAAAASVGFEQIEDLLKQQAAGELNLQTDPVKIYVPIGGGGLIAGVATAMRWAKDAGLMGEQVQVVGVQMEGCDAARRSLPYIRAGKKLPQDLFETGKLFNGRTDGAAVRFAGEQTMTLIADPRFVADVELVSEVQVGQAMLDLTKHFGHRIEPTAALALAGSRVNAAATRSGPKEHHVALVTGSNVDEELFAYFTGVVETAQEKMEAEARRQADLEAYRANLLSLGKRNNVRGPEPPRSQNGATKELVYPYLSSILGGSNAWSGPSFEYRHNR